MVEKKRGYIWRSVSSEAQMGDDKISLEEQERVCRDWCDRNGVYVCGVLTVPGLSRSETDIFTLFEDYASKGIYAYHELRALWKTREMDYLVTYVLNRLGRSNALYAYALENTVRSGATVISVSDGFRVDDSNVEAVLPLGSFAAVNEVRNLVRRRKMGMKSRASRGLKQANRTPFGFLEERNALGKVVRMVPDPQYARLLEDLVTLLLEGVGYGNLQNAMFERFGHGKNGKPYGIGFFYALLHQTATWGHMAQNYRNPKVPVEVRYGQWIYDVTAPVPDMVTVWRNTHPPLFTDEQAELVRAELIRRRSLRGKARPYDANRFSGLLICAECKYYMTVSTGKKTTTILGWRCNTRNAIDLSRRPKCTQTKRLNDGEVQRHIHGVLERMLESGSLEDFDPARAFAAEDRRADIERDMAALDSQMYSLATAISRIPPDNPSWVILVDQHAALGTQRQALEQALQTANAQASRVNAREQYRALEEIRALTLERFWQLPNRTINQFLRRLFGQYRLACQDGKIDFVTVAPAKEHGRRAV